jgi:hypothetical protein
MCAVVVVLFWFPETPVFLGFATSPFFQLAASALTIPTPPLAKQFTSVYVGYMPDKMSKIIDRISPCCLSRAF